MNASNNNKPSHEERVYDEIDIREVLRIFWRGKWIIVGVTLVFAVLSVIIALSLPNKYTSFAKLAPAEESQAAGLGALGGQLGGLASLAGVNLPAGESDNSMLAMEILRSRQFLSDFVRRRDIVVELMAADRWNPVTGELSYDDTIYDMESRTWVRKVKPPQQPEPSDWEIVEEFREIMSVDMDDRTGFITLAVEHESPVLARQWAVWLVEDINDNIRERDIAEAQRSLQYLEDELQRVTLANMEQVFYQLVEQQTHKVMMANVRPEYVFRVIDPPVAAEEKSWPPRALICIGITLFGGLLSLVGLLIANMFQRNNLVD